MSHQQSFSSKGTGLPGLNQYKARINILAQGHNAVTPVRLEPGAPGSPVKHSTTECSSKFIVSNQKEESISIQRVNGSLLSRTIYLIGLQPWTGSCPSAPHTASV